MTDLPTPRLDPQPHEDRAIIFLAVSVAEDLDEFPGDTASDRIAAALTELRQRRAEAA